MTVDISEQRTEQRFRSLVLATSSILWTTDAQGRVVEPAESWTRFTDQTFEEFRGNGWLDAVHPEDREHAKSAWAAAVSGRKLYEIEYRLKHHDGTWRHVITRGTPVLDDGGLLREWVCNCVDITDRVSVEQALREEVRITDTLHSMGLALAAELDVQKLVRSITDAATSVIRARVGTFIYNSTQGEPDIVTGTAARVDPASLSDSAKSRPSEFFTSIFGTNRVVRLADVTSGGSDKLNLAFEGMLTGDARVRSFVAVSVVARSSEIIGALFFGHPNAGVFTSRDERILRGIGAQAAIAIDNARLVQDLRKTKQDLSHQLDYTRNITDSVGEGLYVVDAQGKATFVNPAAEQLLGWESRDLLGRDMHEVIHFRHADGSAFAKQTCPLLSVIVTGKSIRHDDDMFIRRDGTGFPVAYTSSPTFENGKVTGAVVAFHDITQRKWAEDTLRRSKEQLEQLVGERTAELEVANSQLRASNRELQDFASVASHDLQEPLRKIQAFGDRLEAKSAAALGPEGQDYLQRMRNAAGRMQTLISDLLQFSRITTRAQPFTPIDLGKIASEVLGDLETAVERSGGRVEIGALPQIDADPTQMRQLIQNLIGNALKFRNPELPPVVKVSSETDTEANVCKLIVRDNGIGFEEKYLDRIFNVFQRLHTRGVYEGTGIGLAVCRKIAERHGGSITARSAPARGSTFIVTLPIRQPSTEEANV
ncbi:MAG TPA: PAS domain S-box protein [Tepidisphaeraceae bacterium]